MLQMITGKKKTKESQEILEKLLEENLNLNDEFTLGTSNGSWIYNVAYNNNIWFTNRELKDTSSPRFWNAFGLANKLNKNNSNNIAVQINIPIANVNRSVSGFFAKDTETDEILLMHRGSVGGSRKGIGKNTFLSWYQPTILEIEAPDGEIDKAILITKLNPNKFIGDLSLFINKVSEFKDLVSAGDIT